MAKNKAANEKRMDSMATKFYAAINKIKAQMKKDRAHHERQLAKSTNALYKTLMDNQAAQEATNKKLTAETRRVELDAAKALREAKDGFASKIGALTKTVNDNEKKVNKKVLKLTGIVSKNAVKDAQGRAQLRKVQAWNKAQVKLAVKNAIHKGEQRALEIEKKMKGVNAKTRQNLNHRITTEIGVLRKQIHGQILDLELDTKAARAEMKRELMFAIKSEATLAKSNLNKAVAWATGEFTKLHNALAAEKKKSKKGNKALKKYADFEKKKAVSILNNAVMAQNKALLSYKNEMCNNLGSEDIKDCPKSTRGKMNKRLDREAARMKANAIMVQAQMKAQTAKINASLEGARKSAQAQLAAAGAASLKRYNSVMKAVEDGVSAARAKANKRFSEVQVSMANERARQDKNLSGAVNELNDKIASAAALEDTRFKTVKDIKAAKASARAQVKQAKKAMLVGIAAVQAHAKAVESRILGDIEDVSAMIVSDKASQVRINKRVSAEIKKIVKLENGRHSESVRARGKLKAIMNENKRAAAEETAALAKASTAALAKTRSQAAAYKRSFAKDLTKATKKLYGAIATSDTKQTAANAALTGKLGAAKASAAAGIAGAKKMFSSRLNTLTNAVVSNAAKFEKNLGRMTGVAMSWKKSAAGDRKNIRTLRSAMKADLDKSIARAIQLGEAKAKAVQQRALSDINKASNALLTTASAKIEAMADNVFKLVQGNRQKIADNYLSLKAYAACSDRKAHV